MPPRNNQTPNSKHQSNTNHQLPITKRFGDSGVLLVEAVLSAVVIAVGLTFITKALGSQLQALQRVEEYAVLRGLAQQALRTMEVDLQAGKPPRGPHEGSFGEPYQDYQWELNATELEDRDLPLEVSRVTLSVRRSDHPAATYSVHAVWPSTLVPGASP